MPACRVGFWNIQKKNVPLDEGDRWNTFASHVITNWYTAHPFDLLILAEVSRRKTDGDNFINQLAATLNGYVRRPAQNFIGSFIWSYNAGGSVNTCNMAVLWNDNIPELMGLGGRIEPFWNPDYYRPVLMMRAGNCYIGGIHARAANQRKAEEEIWESCAEIDSNHGAGVLIGDMNIRYGRFSMEGSDAMNNLGWRSTPPDLMTTWEGQSGFGGSGVLDYIWRNAGVWQCRASPPFSRYADFRVVDHAPIQYDLMW